jgi:hypothetical protein
MCTVLNQMTYLYNAKETRVAQTPDGRSLTESKADAQPAVQGRFDSKAAEGMASRTELMQLVPMFDETKAFLKKVETVDKSDALMLAAAEMKEEAAADDKTAPISPETGVCNAWFLLHFKPLACSQTLYAR